MSESSSWGSGPVYFGANCVVGPNVHLGLRREAAVRGNAAPLGPVFIGDDSILGANVIIHEGSRIGKRVFFDDNTRVGYACTIGDDCRLEYGAVVSDRVSVGSGSIISGFLGDAVEVGVNCVVMGTLVHELSTPISSPWGIDEPAPRVEDGAVVGMGAVVVGGISIGERSYVAAGATVTKDVPAEHIAVATNVFIPRSEWRGRRLERLLDLG